MSENFKLKYLKYKNKYLELKGELEGGLAGGLINKINPEDLDKEKKPFSVPEKLKYYIKLITINKSNVRRVGTSSFKIQPYFGDVDILDIIDKNIPTDILVASFVKELQQIVSKILEDKYIFYSDFKAGNMHWTSNEILKGEKDGITLFDACKTKGVIKIDIIAPYNQRYVEMSSFFILKSNTGYVNVNTDYFEIYQQLLLDDIEKFKDVKPLKAIKRFWSLSKYKHDLQTMSKLKDIIHSNLSLLGQITADLETIKLLIEHDSPYDVDFMITAIDKFKELISTILDIQIDEKVVYVMIENIMTIIKAEKAGKTEIFSKEKLIESIDTFYEYLLEIINKETKEYIKSIDFHFPSDKLGFFEKIKHFLLN